MKTAISLFFLCLLFGAFQFASINTYALSLTDAGICIFYFAALKRIIWNGDIIEIRKTAPMLLLFAMLFFATISGIAPLLSSNSNCQSQFIKTYIHFLYVWFVAFLAMTMNIPLDAWLAGIKSWVFISIPINIFGAYQIVARAFGLPFAWLSIFTHVQDARGFDSSYELTQLSLSFEGFYRATSIFSEPSALAAFNAFVLTAMLVPYIRNTDPFVKSATLRQTIVVCAVIGSFLTFSLTGITLLAATLATALFHGRSARLLKLLKSSAILILVLLFTDAAVENYAGISVTGLFMKRIGGIFGALTGGGIEMTSGESFFTRADTMQKAVEIWVQHPLAGVGLGCYYYYTKSPEMLFADSTLFQALSETGIGGFLTIIGLCIFAIITPLAIYRHAYQNDAGKQRTNLREFAGYIGVHVLVSMFTGNSLVGITLWLLLGMIFALAQLNSAPRFAHFAMRTPLCNIFTFRRTLSATTE